MDWSGFWDSLSTWIGDHGLRILLITAGSFLFYQGVKTFATRIVQRFIDFRKHQHSDSDEAARRAKTITNMVVGAIGASVATVAVFMVLAEFNVNIGPLIASAGVVGVAIGFGAQSLIKDTLNGLFIVLEDQFKNGDVIKVAGFSGVVEDLNMRRTVLRDLDGIVHIIPNGQILTVSNYTREWARVNLNVPVAYSTDLAKATEVINRVGREIAADPEFSSMIISSPQVLRVDKFGDSGIELKILGDTKPNRQWAVTGELRRRLKNAFDEAGIEIPFPHTKLIFDSAQLEKYTELRQLADMAAISIKDRQPSAEEPLP